MRGALQLFESLEIEYIPSSEARRRGPRSTCCGNVVQRLILKHGLPHAVIVLKTIIETEGNKGELIADVIHAISDLIRAHPRWVGLGGIWLEAFDQISLAQVRRTAKATGVQPLRDAIMTLLCVELDRILGPSKLPKAPKPIRTKREPKPPRSVTRIPEIEKNIALGNELLTLRAATASNSRFGRQVRKRFPDVDQRQTSQTMRVARLYAGRPDVWRAASWRTLIELASPKMSSSVRQALEAKILAGQSVSAPEIRRARGPLKGGSPKRRPINQPASMAA
jgi:hypothetical protein